MKIEMIWLMMGIAILSCEAESKSTSITSDFFVESKSFLNADTIEIDLKTSKIYWKGTKMRGLGKHEGTIDLKSGFLIKPKSQIVGGEFVIDMESIAVTDIPEHETIPIRNLTNHLKSTDFFDVDQFPESTFSITSSVVMDQGKSMLHGTLTIRGITNPVSIEVNKSNGYHAKIILDRFKWDIAYEGSWVDRTFVDREIELKIDLIYLDQNQNK